jgi:xylulokinase
MKDMGLAPTVIRAGKANLFLSNIYQNAIANLTNTTIELYDTDGAQGAARGAGIGLKYYSANNAFAGLKLLKRISPSDEDLDQYEEVYHSWLQCLNNVQIS